MQGRAIRAQQAAEPSSTLNSDTPKSSSRRRKSKSKRSSRRLTADLGSVQDLLACENTAGSPHPPTTEAASRGVDDSASNQAGTVESSGAVVADQASARGNTREAAEVKGAGRGSGEGGRGGSTGGSSDGRRTAEYEGFCNVMSGMESPEVPRGGDDKEEREDYAHTARLSSVLGMLESVGSASVSPTMGSGSAFPGRDAAELLTIRETARCVGGDPDDGGTRHSEDTGESVILPRLLGFLPGVSEDDARRNGGGGGRVGRESEETAGDAPVQELLECTPSPGGGLDQSVADGSALREKTLARMYGVGAAPGDTAVRLVGWLWVVCVWP